MFDILVFLVCSAVSLAAIIWLGYQLRNPRCKKHGFSNWLRVKGGYSRRCYKCGVLEHRKLWRAK